ncbi:Zinc finger protein VAR3, chloroplastic [Linum perenne]
MYKLLCSGRVSVYLRTQKHGGSWCFSWLKSFSSEAESLDSSKFGNEIPQPSLSSESELSKENGEEFHISHPWPEWVDLMELLFKRGYYEVDGNPFQAEELGAKETNSIRTACLNFARDQFGLIRFFSRKDIQIISKFGCPTLDRKVINSAKRLRAHVGVDEGKVCSSCNLRGDCDRAYVKAREDEGGRTVDVMRILVTHGLDFVSGTVVNKPCQNKLVKESVRNLLKEMAEYGSQQLDSDGSHNRTFETMPRHSSSSEEKGVKKAAVKRGDWICPKCEFLNFARNIKCLRCSDFNEERLKHLREDRDHLPLKKGDWICERCNFLNFAKNTRCLQCEERPPKRHMNPGEWECESCNYINFRRNMICLKCDHKRPKASNASSTPYPHEHVNGGANAEDGTSSTRSVNKGDDQRNPHSNKWRFVEEGRDADDDGSKFMNFPIAGGKSNLSRDPTAREEWKLQMLERSRVGTRGKGSSEEHGNDADRQQGPGWLNHHDDDDDDDDMATWFGNGKKSET